jgi:hypothetical protein
MYTIGMQGHHDSYRMWVLPQTYGVLPMAVKKESSKVNPVPEERAVKPVRLELSETDHERLEACARARGLNKASYCRQAVLKEIKADEAGNA